MPSKRRESGITVLVGKTMVSDFSIATLAQGARVHIVGIGGIGTSALAQWLAYRGLQVEGSDAASTTITQELTRLGIPVYPEREATLSPETAAVVYTDAAPPTHPLRQAAAEQTIPQLSYAEALGQLTAPYQVIAVAGSHGKSTTTAMTGLICEALGLDPIVIVGTQVPQWQTEHQLGNFRPGQGTICVVEADEYQDHFLQLRPAVAIITSIDHDHVDYFPTAEDYQQAFNNFLERLVPDGTVVIEQTVTKVLPEALTKHKTLTYNLTDPTASLSIANLDQQAGQYQAFSVRYGDKTWDNFMLHIPGKYMVSNALAAIGAALAVTPDEAQVEAKARAALKTFRGTWRRFELIGQLNGAPAYSDYAHHPTELAAVLDAAHDWFGSRRVVVAFQPHQQHRTDAFGQEFMAVLREHLAETDYLILCPVFGVLGREATTTHSIASWLEASHPNGQYVADLSELSAVAAKVVTPEDVVLFVGAGTIDAVARTVVTPLGNESR
jgi:UDP-N-acetylmuramate--alanine ligase